jgi:DNA-directed RNA polymerase specialized sigma24 family protein
MTLEEVLRYAEKSALAACRSYNRRYDDDIKQEARLRAWRAFRDGPCDTPSMVRVVAKRAVIDKIRSERSYAIAVRKYPRRDLIRFEANEPPTATKETLNFVEARLDSEERLLFRHLRRGHRPNMIAKALGYPKTTIYRMVEELMEKARRIVSAL